VAIALVLLAIAGVIFWDMSRLQLTSVYGLGPKAAPIVIRLQAWRCWRSATWCSPFAATFRIASPPIRRPFCSSSAGLRP
jgi:hypothetical protein